MKLANQGEIDDPNPLLPQDLSPRHTSQSAVGSTASTYSDNESPTFGSDEIDPDLQSLADVQPFDSVTSELKHRLQMGDAPLLLPPKDYDTISRAHGNLEQINARRCMNLNIIGSNAIQSDLDADNGTETTSSENDATNLNERNNVENQQVAKLKSPENRPSPNSSPKLQHMFLAPSDIKKSPQIAHKPTNLYESKLSPNMPQKFGFPEMSSPVNAIQPGKTSPLLAPSITDFVYPPKGINSPKSPRVVQSTPKSDLSRQNSQSSLSSDSSKLSQRSDEVRSAQPIPHYVYGSNDDVYALPMKATKQPSAMDELPPDYQDDDDLLQPGANQRYGPAYLTRSLPEELLRNKGHLSNGPRINSGELRLGARIGSPIFMTGPQTPVRSPGIPRKGPNNRYDN